MRLVTSSLVSITQSKGRTFRRPKSNLFLEGGFVVLASHYLRYNVRVSYHDVIIDRVSLARFSCPYVSDV